MKTPALFGLVLLLPPFAIVADEKPELVYSASIYDPARDVEADLAGAQKLAAAENRRILLVAGGNWCPWCRAISAYFESNEAVLAILAEAYVIQKVNVSDEKSNTSFLNPFPAIRAYPHFFVLDDKGELLVSADTGPFESGRGYDEAKMVAFFEKWRSEKP